MKRVYLDYAAGIGNPFSVHAEGREAKKILDDARSRIGAVLNCRAEEIVFTGSGTEANNLAIFGVPPGHIISTNIEHHSVLGPLQKRGNVTYVPVKPNGIVDPLDIAKALRPDTVLVSVIYANNEIGTIQPIAEIAKIIRNFRKSKLQNPNHKELKFGASDLEFTGKLPAFHVDACQAAGFLDINVQNLGVDLMTINGSKIYGPKGTGALFVRRGVRLAPMILGGDQERGLRAGTENPELLMEFAKALAAADARRERESKRLIFLRDRIITSILTEIPGSYLNGDPIQRLPNNINISFEDIDGEMLMLALDLKGIAVSTGAACTVTSNEPSHVLRAISPQPIATTPPAPLIGKGGGRGGIVGNLRITLGHSTTKKDLEYTLEVLKKEVAKMRARS